MLGAGNSTRFDLPTKKQWLRIDNEPLWLYVTNKISKMYNFEKIIVIGSKDEIKYMKKFADFEFYEGGNSRSESLKNALLHVNSKYVMVSDIARCCICEDTVNTLIKNKLAADCIVPALDEVDTLHYKNKPINREFIKKIQTPQLSNTDILKKALADEEFTDESSAILNYGGSVFYINGQVNAAKLTCKSDLKQLHCLKKPSLDMFNGLGFDVHAFGEKRALLLGGVRVHESMGLKAHSDGDVLTHALIDALLGAIGYGDIGELFPDTDELYKNVNSMQLLKKVCDFVYSVGFCIINVDITIMAQTPKISPYKDLIAKNIAKALHVKSNFVNIKATTTEKLGFVGRSEGIAVQASTMLKYFNWTNL